MVSGGGRPGPPTSPGENTAGLANGFQTLAGSVSPGSLFPAVPGPTWHSGEMVRRGPESWVLAILHFSLLLCVLEQVSLLLWAFISPSLQEVGEPRMTSCCSQAPPLESLP